MATPLREDVFWAGRDYAEGVKQVTTPVQLVGGWYDILLPWMLEDFAALQAAGREPQLIVGAWAHISPGLVAAGMREALGWLRAHLLDDDRLVRPDAVRVQITGETTGEDGWRSLESWPPPGTGERRLWVGGGGRLRRAAEPADAPDGADGYRYDPADPTPSLGGPLLLARHPVLDNAPLEARADVLTYTTEPLAQAVEAIGVARAELHVRCSAPYFDVFARVCDVDARRRVAQRLRRARARRRPSSSSRPPTGPGSSRSSCGRWATASPPGTASACRSPPARTRATRATRAPARIRPPRPSCGRSTWSCCTAARASVARRAAPQRSRLEEAADPLDRGVAEEGGQQHAGDPDRERHDRQQDVLEQDGERQQHDGQRGQRVQAGERRGDERRDACRR